MSGSRTYALRRRPVVEALLAERGDLLVVAGLGAPAWDAAAAGDHALTFPLWGAMGGALSMGLGLALARPDRRVLVITGDGEMLMGLGSIATAAAAGPGNLSVAVLDNECYGETGMQATHTAFGVDLAAVAAAAGWPISGTVRDEDAMVPALTDLKGGSGPVFYTFKVRAEDVPLVLPPRDGEHLKERFRTALLGGEPGESRRTEN
jgi:thiamine pyrophosphate-dependent acetolactate synthase large subunit-like protein